MVYNTLLVVVKLPFLLDLNGPMESTLSGGMLTIARHWVNSNKCTNIVWCAKARNLLNPILCLKHWDGEIEISSKCEGRPQQSSLLEIRLARTELLWKGCAGWEPQSASLHVCRSPERDRERVSKEVTLRKWIFANWSTCSSNRIPARKTRRHKYAAASWRPSACARIPWDRVMLEILLGMVTKSVEEVAEEWRIWLISWEAEDILARVRADGLSVHYDGQEIRLKHKLRASFLVKSCHDAAKLCMSRKWRNLRTGSSILQITSVEVFAQWRIRDRTTRCCSLGHHHHAHSVDTTRKYAKMIETFSLPTV